MWTKSTSFLIVIIISLYGCSSSNVRRAEPIEVVVPAPLATQAGPKIPPQIQNGFSRAISLIKQGSLEEAHDLLLLVKLGYPGLIGVHLNLALLMHQLGDINGSLFEVEEVLRLSPRHAIAYNLRGSNLREKGRFTEARVDYAKAIKIKPDYAAAYLNMGILFDIYLQYWEDAKEYYLAYLELVPEDKEKVTLWIYDLDLRIQLADQ
jgi:tetratricopeptide (TPR) repeat protein